MMDLSGKRALVFGVASEDSLAWSIATSLAQNGAKVTLAYQKRFRSRVTPLVQGKPWIEATLECDVTVEDEVKQFFAKTTGKYDMLVHAIAFAPASALEKNILHTNAEDFAATMNVSAYSLVRLVSNALPHLGRGASVITLTYLGGVKHVPGYRVMGTAKAALEQLVRELAATVGPAGVRVNAISAGPVKTLAASGVPGFDKILAWMESTSPLRRNITAQDVANAALYLLSDLSSNVTGQTLYVDAGYSIVGVPPNLDRLFGEGPGA